VSYGRGDAESRASGGGFLEGEEAQSRALDDAVGYEFKKLPNGEYSHPVILMVLSPNGKITRYIYGFEYDPEQLKLSLLDASEGAIAKSLGDRILHYCYRYDPNAGEYSVEAMAVMRVGGVITVVCLSIFLGVMFAGERLRRRVSRSRGARPVAGPAAGASGDAETSGGHGDHGAAPAGRVTA